MILGTRAIKAHVLVNIVFHRLAYFSFRFIWGQRTATSVCAQSSVTGICYPLFYRLPCYFTLNFFVSQVFFIHNISKILVNITFPVVYINISTFGISDAFLLVQIGELAFYLNRLLSEFIMLLFKLV